jgi:hypothetical protein
MTGSKKRDVNSLDGGGEEQGAEAKTPKMVEGQH